MCDRSVFVMTNYYITCGTNESGVLERTLVPGPLAGPGDLSQGGLRRSRALIEQALSGGEHAAALQLDSTNAEARIPTLSKLLILKLIGMELKWPVGVPQQGLAVVPLRLLRLSCEPDSVWPVGRVATRHVVSGAICL